MRKTLITALFGLATLLVVSPLVQADVVTFKMDTGYAESKLYSGSVTDFITANLAGGQRRIDARERLSAGGTPGANIDGLWFTNEADERLHLIYAPFSTQVDRGFYIPGLGNQQFGGMNTTHTTWTGAAGVSLADSSHTAVQKAMVQSLFDNLYYTAYGDYGTTGDPFAKDNVWAPTLSNAIHAILYSTNYDTGQFVSPLARVDSDGRWYAFQNVDGWVMTESMHETLTSLVGAAYEEAMFGTTNGWDALGFERRDTEVMWYQLSSLSPQVSTLFGTLFFSDVTTPFFHVVGYADGNTVVPEPATLAVLGLGLAGLGIARARRRK